MDPLSATASVVAIIQISQQVFNLCQNYYTGVKDARRHIQRLRNEVISLQDVLTSIVDLADEPEAANLATLHLLNQADGPLEQCKVHLTLLVAKLAPGDGPTSMRRVGLRALRWPFKSKDVDKAVSGIERYKSVLILALNADQAGLVLAIRQSIIELKRQSDLTQSDVQVTRYLAETTLSEIVRHQADIGAHQKEELRRKLIKWLSVTDPSSNYLAARKKHETATGEWLLRHGNFEMWKKSQNTLFWLSGIPGCGKTILTSTAVQHMVSHCERTPGSAIAYFYFDFNDAMKQKAHSCLSSILAHLCAKVNDIPGELETLYNRYYGTKQKATTAELIPLLKAMATTYTFDDIYIVLDAVDECPKGEEREGLLDLIAEIRSWTDSRCHLLISSREELDIKRILTPLLTIPAMSLQGPDVASDIELYISSQLTGRLANFSDEVQAKIKITLSRGANGMFRWVFCQVEALKKCPPMRNAVLKALRSLPATLDATYARILGSIEDIICQKLARRCLIWLAYSRKPVTVVELAEAALLDRRPFDPEDRLCDPYYVVELLGSLVTVIDHRGADFVELAHFSVQEYLMSPRTQRTSVGHFAINEPDAHSFLTESCFWYLDFCSQPSTETTISDEDIEAAYPLFFYVGSFCMQHLLLVPVESRQRIISVIPRLFPSNTVTKLRPQALDLGAFSDWLWYHSVLHMFASLGIESVVLLQLERGTDVNSRDRLGQTALNIAANSKSEGVVRLLLERGADVAVCDETGFTAMHRVFYPCYPVKRYTGYIVPILRLLSEYEARSNAQASADTAGEAEPTCLVSRRNMSWETPMSVFTSCSPLADTAALEWMLSHGASLTAKNFWGETPLHLAVTRPIFSAAHITLMLKTADIMAKTDTGEIVLQYAERAHKQGASSKFDPAVLELVRERTRLVIESGEAEERDRAQKERRREEIGRLMEEWPRNPRLVTEGEYAWELWRDFNPGGRLYKPVVENVWARRI